MVEEILEQDKKGSHRVVLGVTFCLNLFTEKGPREVLSGFTSLFSIYYQLSSIDCLPASFVESDGAFNFLHTRDSLDRFDDPILTHIKDTLCL